MEIPIKDRVVIIDDCKYHLVMDYKWQIMDVMGGYLYAVTRVNGKPLLMHRLLTGATKGFVVDHINHNGLDNRLCNLRLCTHAENMANRKIAKSNKLGVKGVYIDKKGGKKKYRAEIVKNGKKTRMGFERLDDARDWYIEMSMKMHGEFAFNQ